MTKPQKRSAPKSIEKTQEKRTKLIMQNPTTSTISTFNAYAELTDNESEIEINHTPATKIKIPPIVVINMQHQKITEFMHKNSIKNFNLKYISLGIKVLCNTVDDIPSQKTTKFVLSVHSTNINFLDVKKMNTKRESDSFALYLVYFNNKTVKLQELKQIKYVLNVVIKWQPYIPSKNGPTQCNNCQLHGHGSKNCSLPPRCAKCAGKHQTT